MRTTIKMLLVLMLAMAMLSFVACSDDDTTTTPTGARPSRSAICGPISSGCEGTATCRGPR